MRHYDYTVNVTWVMAHYNAAKHYIESGIGDGEATGGSDWKKYMHPKYQRRIFFPDLWSEEELKNWGNNLNSIINAIKTVNRYAVIAVSILACKDDNLKKYMEELQLVEEKKF